jgi:hypothetical protein
MTFEEMKQALHQRLEALPPAARAELLHVLRLPDVDRVERIGEFWGHPETRTFGELLIDLEEDHAPRPSCSACSRRWSGQRIPERFYPSLYTSGAPHESMERWKPSQDRSR